MVVAIATTSEVVLDVQDQIEQFGESSLISKIPKLIINRFASERLKRVQEEIRSFSVASVSDILREFETLKLALNPSSEIESLSLAHKAVIANSLPIVTNRDSNVSELLKDWYNTTTIRIKRELSLIF